MRAGYRNPLIRLPMTMREIAPVGVVVSLVAAALLRNPRFLPARRVAVEEMQGSTAQAPVTGDYT